MTDDGLGWLRDKPHEGEVLIADGSTGLTYVVDEGYWLEHADECERAGWRLVTDNESEATQ